MRRKILLICLLLFTICMVGCQKNDKIDATRHGLSVENSPEENTLALQSLIDELAEGGGGEIFIPEGEYRFGEGGRQTIGSHCIKMRSNVSIFGEGEGTVLMPVGRSDYGMDMFYFNDYLDLGEANYLENCRFESFVIDAGETECVTYTSAGKGFMFNLFKNCHWRSVTVKNTVATGYGVDCPIDSSITDCTAVGCGSGATAESSGASGFGIGYGYSAEEGIIISGCRAFGNKKFGIFFEHQGRFNSEMYTAEPEADFVITDCVAGENLYDFGGICTAYTAYKSCRSTNPIASSFYFENSSEVSVIDSSASDCPVAIALVGETGAVTVHGCTFSGVEKYDVMTDGTITLLSLTEIQTDLGKRLFLGEITELIDKENSWN